VLKRGFIGPIGDDLPSLIPLLFGLVMFFSAFTTTFNSFDRNNVIFKDDITVMKISRVMQSNSYIYSYENFEELCSGVGIVNLNFVTGISEQAARGNDVQDLFEVEIFENSDGDNYYCTNLESVSLSNPLLISDFLSLEDAADFTVVSRVFPIVVEDSKVVKPMHLFVVAWK